MLTESSSPNLNKEKTTQIESEEGRFPNRLSPYLSFLNKSSRDLTHTLTMVGTVSGSEVCSISKIPQNDVTKLILRMFTKVQNHSYLKKYE